MRHLAFALLLAACKGSGTDTQETEDTEPVDSAVVAPVVVDIVVEVTLDGQPLPGAVVVQGGRDKHWTADDQGRVTVPFDTSVGNGLARAVISSHPDARIGSAIVHVDDTEPHRIDLVRFVVGDNPEYVYQDPGEPDRRANTGQCAHCHVTLNADWYESPHRTSASNPAVQDLYTGAAWALTDETSCVSSGGQWLAAPEPGTGDSVSRCFVGDGTLPTLNSACDPVCDGSESAFGGCADCHAPGIDGAAGGRNLSDATGHAYDFGVHCDVCHKVESIDLENEPGTAGRLVLNRPLEPLDDAALGPWEPTMFGPYDDAPHVRMGSVAREVFHDALFCAGCHQQDQPVLVPGASIDTARWPTERLPIHSTYEEWLTTPTSPELPCQGCHMPAASDVGNSADLGNIFDVGESLAGGWYRPPGDVRHHSWFGPRQRDSGLLELAATIELDTATDTDTWVVSATVSNVGPSHAIPTGEPMRSLILAVRASCDGVELLATGGDVVPDFGGAIASKLSTEDWSEWPTATVGDTVQVVTRTGAWHDYAGFGPFGDGRFDAQAKGMPVEHLAGSATITALDAGVATFDTALPAGDVAYLIRSGWPVDGQPALALAGTPGFGFARVLADQTGARMVPHYLAVDVVSDNRLMPRQSWTSEHRFDRSACTTEPTADAVLIHRAYPRQLATQRGWALVDSVMTEVTR